MERGANNFPGGVSSSASASVDLRRGAGTVGAARAVSEDVIVKGPSAGGGGVAVSRPSLASGSHLPSGTHVLAVRGSTQQRSRQRDNRAEISNSILDASATTTASTHDPTVGTERGGLCLGPPSRRVTGGNFLVSEQEDEGGPPVGGPSAADDDEPNAGGGHARNPSLVRVLPPAAGDRDGGLASSATSGVAAGSNAANKPAEIPRETDELDEGKDADGEDEESDYEYEYEDEDEGHYSGFLISDQPHAPIGGTSSLAAVASAATAAPQDVGTHKVEDEEDEKPAAVAEVADVSAASAAASSPSGATASPSEQDDDARRKKPRWREPSRSAVSMSLRAESEKTGGRRRLAADLYKIMMADTDEAGFQIEPKSEDSMDRWTIRLFAFDEDSNLSKDLMVLGLEHVELEMSFPDQYPFEPPFVRVVRPRFKRQTGFVMNGALCMELLTKEGWNPVNDIESVIVSVRSLLVVGDGRLQAAVDLPEKRREALLAKALAEKRRKEAGGSDGVEKAGEEAHSSDEGKAGADAEPSRKKQRRMDAASAGKEDVKPVSKSSAGSYTTTEARAAYSHLSDYHKKKGWDSSGWWARKG